MKLFGLLAALKRKLPRSTNTGIGADFRPNASTKTLSEPISKQLLRSQLIVVGALFVALIAGFLALVFGAKPMTLTAAFDAIIHPGQDVNSIIVWALRLPRSIAAWLGGAGLAVSGYLLQSITRNPLASPELTGVTAGTVVVIVAAFVFFPTVSSTNYPFIGAIGGLGAALLVLWVARGGQASPFHLALGGVCVALFFNAITMTILLRGAPQSPSLLFWLSGGFQGRSWPQVYYMLPWVLIGILGALASQRALTIMSLGDEMAASMGIRLRPWKLFLLVCAICPVAGVVPVAGSIAFVGLAVPHLVRLLRPADTLWAMLLNLSLGGLLLLVADALSRSVASPREIPVGIFTAIIGGPFIVFLVQSRRFLTTMENNHG